MHQHVFCQIHSRDFHTASSRKACGVFAHLIVVEHIGARVGLWLWHEHAILHRIECGKASAVEVVNAVAALQAQRLHDVLHDVAVEALSAHLLNHCRHDIERIVAVFIPGARTVVVVALGVVGVSGRVHSIETLPIALRIVEA